MEITGTEFYSYNPHTNNNINFRGHIGCDVINRFGKSQRLTTETAFFREYDTLKFAVNYINEVFKNIKEKRFLVGACSSGEEVWSLKMLMGNTPVKITGFDLSPKQIKNAQKAVYELSRPESVGGREFMEKYSPSGFKDYFLGVEPDKLTDSEKAQKQMFDRMFENITDKPNSIILGLNERIRKVFDISYMELKKLHYKLRDMKQQDCKFITGNIEDLNKINGCNKNQLFSFRNALYHITTESDSIGRYPYDPEEIKPKLDKIFKQVNHTLMKKGLFILGEKEHNQGGDMNIVCASLLDNGFVPIRTKDNLPYYNVWAKYKDVN